MIGKVVIGKSFKGCISYCLNDKLQQEGKEQPMQGRVEKITNNLCDINDPTAEIIRQFQAVRLHNTRLSKPVMHITLSFAPGEQLSNDKLKDICDNCAKEMGFANNQYIAVQHIDTNHRHLHIVANRVGFDAKTVSDSNSYKRIAAFCRKTEKEYGLQEVLSPKKYLSKERQQLPRYDSRKEQMKTDIGNAVLNSTNLDQFTSLLKAKGYTVTKSRGISFTDPKGVGVKGSDLGYSLTTIERLLKLPAEVKRLAIEKKKGKQSTSVPQAVKPASQNVQINQNKPDSGAQLANALLSPVETNSSIPNPLLQKKKKRKRHHQ